MVEIGILEPIRNAVGRLVLGGVFLLVIWLWAGKHEHNNRRSSNCHSHQTRNRGPARASIYFVENVILTKCFPTLLGCMCSLLCKSLVTFHHLTKLHIGLILSPCCNHRS